MAALLPSKHASSCNSDHLFPLQFKLPFFIIEILSAEPQILSWLTPPENVFPLVRVLILKLWPFVFEYFVFILVKTFTVLLLISCMITSECVSSKEENERYGFSHTNCCLRTPNSNLTIYMGFL